MGNKSGRARQYLSFLLTVGGLIALLGSAACVPLFCKGARNSPPDQPVAVIAKEDEPPVKSEGCSSQAQLAQYRNDLAEGFFDTVIQQCLLVVNQNDSIPPADIALYALGEVYAHYAYPGKDYALSKQYFSRLIANFPESPLSSEARTFVGIYESFAEKEKKIATLEKEQKAKSAGSEAIANHNFELAVKENLQVIKVAGQKPPADSALYNLGLIYAHIDNPGKDFQKARRYFAELIKEFPASPLVEESRVWLGLFEVFEKIQQIDLEIEQQKKQLNR